MLTIFKFKGKAKYCVDVHFYLFIFGWTNCGCGYVFGYCGFGLWLFSSPSFLECSYVFLVYVLLVHTSNPYAAISIIK